jgi:hypothetical protein
MQRSATLLQNVTVPDHESRDRDVVLVRRTIYLGKPRGVGNLEWGGDGEGMGRGRSVYEQPGTKVDGIASRQRRDSKQVKGNGRGTGRGI